MATCEPKPAERTKRLLFASTTHCAFPGCAECLVLRCDHETISIVVDVAHIRSGVPNGPRDVKGYNRLREFENLLLLCRKHHRLVDHSPPSSSRPRRWTGGKDDQVAQAGERMTDGLLTSSMAALCLLYDIGCQCERGNRLQRVSRRLGRAGRSGLRTARRPGRGGSRS